ncbi:hypothetical protein TEH11_0741 [Tetragenococcus halophilus subsp. halophilus]|uniref:Uncharacterized protein n=2 Tax=Tetragenococcus halophilus TaxID=51669 RepID=A0AAN1SEQ4_TETHN|nr:hypothetical protein TEH_03130 [Tetragenococcus halophilus NBRC 12172]GBD58480.1 hypothetical protein TEHN0098T_0476 [Tetragenococcus halophilus subsp. halophilus]GBD61058.1 hypothetical protein TEH11_0741 [Tetragenococcus halophilus subsp. halophilus]GBD69871.1 hypothetical protein TEHN7121_0417 [Tetragenococcus halophilus subsp. halophilus]
MMEAKGQPMIWKEKSDLKLVLVLNDFIEKTGITSVRLYQKCLKDRPKEAPSLWFITQKYGSKR